MSTPALHDRPDRSEPAPKMNSPDRKHSLRPRVSDNQPEINSSEATPMLYAVNTQLSVPVDVPGNAAAILRNASEITVTSSETMKLAIEATASVIHARRSTITTSA